MFSFTTFETDMFSTIHYAVHVRYPGAYITMQVLSSNGNDILAILHMYTCKAILINIIVSQAFALGILPPHLNCFLFYAHAQQRRARAGWRGPAGRPDTRSARGRQGQC